MRPLVSRLKRKRFMAARCATFALSGCLLTLGGCQKKQSFSPQSAVEHYAIALEEGRHQDAYRMLSSESRDELSFEEFTRLIEENPDEVQSLLASLQAPASPPMVKARFTTKSGDVVELTYEEGAWKVDESAVQIYGQSSPRQALDSFIRAYDRRRFDVLLRFVPDAQKEGLTAAIVQEAWLGEQQLEMEQIIEGLRPQVAQGQIELLGDRASMSYAAGGSVELVREHGVWKIEDFQ